MPSITIDTPQNTRSGRSISGTTTPLAMKTKPKTPTMMNGVRSIIFASGARSSDRKPAREIAETCSDNHGISRSSKPRLAVPTGRGRHGGRGRFGSAWRCNSPCTAARWCGRAATTAAAQRRHRQRSQECRQEIALTRCPSRPARQPTRRQVPGCKTKPSTFDELPCCLLIDAVGLCGHLLR